MSIGAVGWALRQSGLSTGEKVTLLVLACHANPGGYCWPSQGLLAKETSQCERTVRRAIVSLAERRLIERGRGEKKFRVMAQEVVEKPDRESAFGCVEPVDKSQEAVNKGGEPVDNFQQTGQRVRFSNRRHDPKPDRESGPSER